MLFTSFSFFVFFAATFFVHWLLAKNNYKFQNIVLLVASYFFYAWAEWKMLPLLVLCTIVFYVLGKRIKASSEKAASLLTTIGVVVGVGMLLYFKYFNFFIQSFASFFESLGLSVSVHTFNIIMPLGVSYFTFKLISYVVDLHRNKIDPCDDFIAFSVYVSFFPTILSGPIDRPQSFIPQIQKVRSFDYSWAVEGLRQFLWGLFKKVVLADQIAIVTDRTWSMITLMPGSTLLIVAVLYAIQLYMDFSGYSDMAIGIGKLLGVRITRNFNYPFFATNIAEFWRRWHMSLTSWLTDFVFTPLSIRFRDWSNCGLILAIIINMTLVGLWHGADWSFVLFGLYNGLLFVPLIMRGRLNKKQKYDISALGLPSLRNLLKMVFVTLLFSLGLVFFRANSVCDSFLFLSSIVENGIITMPRYIGMEPLTVIITICVFIWEWYMRKYEFGLMLNESPLFRNSWSRILCYYVLLTLILIYSGNSQTFIYYQF